jgi:hypothetical protein
MPRNKRKTQKHLRGGSVPYLSAEKLGYTSPEDMKKDMDMFLVGCHGETTPENSFIIVPANTYLMFTAHSGEIAEGDSPSEKSYISVGKGETKEEYYKKVYSQLFTPYGKRVATGRPQFKETLYIYEPGDVIPDYLLNFRNNAYFFFMHGIYRAPVESLSGDQRAYLGRTKEYIRKLLNEGRMDTKLFDSLDSEDKIDILTKSLEELQSKPSYLTTSIRGTPLYTFLEEACCRKNSENLLFKEPIDQDMLKDQTYTLRLSYILSKITAQPGKTKRFFLLDFCRVTYSAYFKQFKALLRVASFSGKCPLDTERANAFNLRAVALKFCSLAPLLKEKIVQTPEGQTLVRVFKKTLLHARGPQFWIECLGDAWKKVRISTYNMNSEHPLVQNYTGYFYDTEFMKLAELYPVLQQIQSKIPESLKPQLLTFSEPFKNLYNQLHMYLEKLKLEEEERILLVNKIYNIILQKIKPKRFSKEEDILYLKVTSMEQLTKLLKKLEENYFDEDLQELSEKEYDTEENTAILYAPYRNELIYDLNNTFIAHVGHPPIGSSTIYFNGKNVENIAHTIYKMNLIKDNSNTSNNSNISNTNSVSNISENTNSNTNSNNNSSIIPYNSTKNGGYKRKTRRLVRKQKTRATAKNT